MSILIALFFLVISIFLGKYYFKRNFNPISIYSLIWFFLIFFYELKLIRYVDIDTNTWLVIISSHISYLFGVIVFFTARSVYHNSKYSTNSDMNFLSFPEFSAKNIVVIKYVIYITALIGLFGAIQNWMVLLNKFGGITGVLLSANIIYQMRVNDEIEGVIPYLSTFSFVSVFIASLYSAIKNKISPIIILPFIAVILKDLAMVGRTGMLMMLMIYASVFILFKYGINQNTEDKRKSRKRLIIGFLILTTIVIASASAVKTYRAGFEKFQSSTKTLRQLEGNLILSPSIYLYLSSHIGVLNMYLIKDVETAAFGENTFMPLYRILNKFQLIREPRFYQKGYLVPIWTNTGTYLREVHADFGYAGIFLFPFFLSLTLSYFWVKTYSSFNLLYFLSLIYFLLIVFYSFLMNVTRLGNWLISYIILLIIFSFFNHYLVRAPLNK